MSKSLKKSLANDCWSRLAEKWSEPTRTQAQDAALARGFARLAMDAGKWDSGKHPRGQPGNAGQFGSGGGGSKAKASGGEKDKGGKPEAKAKGSEKPAAPKPAAKPAEKPAGGPEAKPAPSAAAKASPAPAALPPQRQRRAPSLTPTAPASRLTAPNGPPSAKSSGGNRRRPTSIR